MPVHPQSKRLLGFQVHRQDLRVPGLAVCPNRLFVGLFESSSYGISSSSPAGHLLLFSGRLALRHRGPVAPSVTPSCHSLVGSDLLSIHTSTYLFLCYFPNIAPKSSKKLLNRMLTIFCPDVTSRDRLDAISLPFARFPRAGCFAYIHYENSSLSRFSWPNPGVFISFFKSVNVILHFECIYVSQFAFGEGELAFFGFAAQTRRSAYNATFSSPIPPGRVRPSRRSLFHCTVSLLFCLE